MIELREATAGQEVPLGYFLDSTDGDTEETGLTIANTDIKLWKNGATTLANKNSGGATHISNGIYYAVLDATDTDTLGPLVIFVHVSGALAVRLECAVLPANVWDSKYSTDKLQVDVTQIGGDTQSATDLKDFADAGYDPTTNKVQGVVLTDTCTTNTDMRGTDSALLAADAPSNFSDLSITSTTGLVDITQTAADKVWSSAARTLTSFGTLISDIWSYSTRTLSAFSTTLAVSVWNVLESAITTASSIGLKLKTNLDATVSSRSSHSAADVWTSTTRALTDKAGFTISGTKQTLDDLNDITVADIISGVADGSYDLQEMLRIIFAATACKMDGGGTTTIHARDSADTKNRITATVDANGNRTAVTLDGS